MAKEYEKMANELYERTRENLRFEQACVMLRKL